MPTFGSRLKAIRVKRKMSGAELGKGLGYPEGDASRQTINDWEAGRHHPNAVQIAKLCQKLETTADYLVLGVDVEAQLFRAREALEALAGVGRLGGIAGQQGKTGTHGQ